jgi:hypothetical protein
MSFAKHVTMLPDEDVLGAVRFAEQGKLLAITTEVGGFYSSERLFYFQIRAPLLAEDFWEIVRICHHTSQDTSET